MTASRVANELQLMLRLVALLRGARPSHPISGLAILVGPSKELLDSVRTLRSGAKVRRRLSRDAVTLWLLLSLWRSLLISALLLAGTVGALIALLPLRMVGGLLLLVSPTLALLGILRPLWRILRGLRVLSRGLIRLLSRVMADLLTPETLRCCCHGSEIDPDVGDQLRDMLIERE